MELLVANWLMLPQRLNDIQKRKKNKEKRKSPPKKLINKSYKNVKLPLLNESHCVKRVTAKKKKRKKSSHGIVVMMASIEEHHTLESPLALFLENCTTFHGF